jgi:hypothetical protein
LQVGLTPHLLQSVMTCANGDKYEGDWKKDKMHKMQTSMRGIGISALSMWSSVRPKFVHVESSHSAAIAEQSNCQGLNAFL